ncbi:MAG: hypothetical protein PHG73_13060 [Pygmaiobacter sp.]|nr:hypothetical protein [Pygmaiobacter sp.]
MRTKIIPTDVKQVSIQLLRGMDARKQRYEKTRLPFDGQVLAAAAQAQNALCGDIADETVRQTVTKKVVESICYSIPYLYMGECYCDRDKFYRYRTDYLRRLACHLGML